MIAENLNTIRKTLPEGVTLVAVSKTKPVELLQEAYDAGQKVFGENKVQEILDKAPQLPNDIQWHMIGHLQRNKVKQVLPFTSLIHGIDSERLLKEVIKQAAKLEKETNILLQIRIAQEETKFGLDPEDIAALLDLVNESDFVKVVGFMGMASNTSDEKQVRQEFAGLKEVFDRYKSSEPNIEFLSMGMSGDYLMAIEEGSNMVRVGSAIFGARNYNNAL